jgi:LL-diaminopimelate aminotransferase
MGFRLAPGLLENVYGTFLPLTSNLKPLSLLLAPLKKGTLKMGRKVDSNKGLKISRRAQNLHEYSFSELQEKKKRLLLSGRRIIDLGAGDPDLTPAAQLLASLGTEIENKENHRHPPYDGLPQLKKKIADWYELRFGFKLDPEEDVLVTSGSKEGLSLSPLAFLEPGEEVLIPELAYPVYEAATLIAGGVPVNVPLREGDYLLDLSKLKVSEKTRLLYMNYPHNPTGAVAGLDFFSEVVEFARRNQLIILSDMAYSEITYDGYVAPSIMQVPEAREQTLEFFSFSKTFSASGWRLGFVCGNKRLLRALKTIKDRISSGVFTPIQWAGLKALDLYPTPTKEAVRVYERRRDLLVSALKEAGWQLNVPLGTIFVWAKNPWGASGGEISEVLLERFSILTTPGENFGEKGKEYVRFSLTASEKDIREAVERIKQFKYR